MTELQSADSFSGIKYFLAVSFFYLTIGILFGGLNALRLANIFEIPQIHDTHWTSTLFGGMTILMMGEIYYIFSLHSKRNKYLDQSMYAVLGLLVLATISNYVRIWIPGIFIGRYFEELVRLASLVYLIAMCIIAYSDRDIFTSTPSLIMLFAAVIWMAISQLVFLGFRGVIGPTFRIPYIYGFFSLTLFGSLNYLLPLLFKSSERGKSLIIRDTLLISASATLLLLNEFVDLSSLLGMIGSLLWGFVGFLFILYVFDLIYKNGMTPSLVGLSIALVMFGFFVFDTFMKAVFPVWVAASHAHFMFLGTLLITIISLSTKVITPEGEDEVEFSMTNLKSVSVGLVILFVSLILLGFILQAFALAGYSGLALFGSIILLEIAYLID